MEIALVYFRVGYQEQHYSDGDLDFWGLRYDLERSLAVKLPSIDTQLLTLKKFQEAFNNPEYLTKVLEKHPDKEESVSVLKEAFEGIYSLEDLESAETKELI